VHDGCVLRVVGMKMTVIKIMPVVVDMGKGAVFVLFAIMAVSMQITRMLFKCSIVMLVPVAMGDVMVVAVLLRG